MIQFKNILTESSKALYEVYTDDVYLFNVEVKSGDIQTAVSYALSKMHFSIQVVGSHFDKDGVSFRLDHYVEGKGTEPFKELEAKNYSAAYIEAGEVLKLTFKQVRRKPVKKPKETLQEYRDKLIWQCPNEECGIGMYSKDIKRGHGKTHCKDCGAKRPDESTKQKPKKKIEEDMGGMGSVSSVGGIAGSNVPFDIGVKNAGKKKPKVYKRN